MDTTPSNSTLAALDRLDQAYRTALADTDGAWHERMARREAIRAEIATALGDAERAQRMVDSIEAEVEHEAEIDTSRRSLHDAFDDIDHALITIDKMLRHLASDSVYDAEIADTDPIPRDAAITGIRINLAALRHFTRNAKPETRP